jgi:hypothetical protein
MIFGCSGVTHKYFCYNIKLPGHVTMLVEDFVRLLINLMGQFIFFLLLTSVLSRILQNTQTCHNNLKDFFSMWYVLNVMPFELFLRSYNIIKLPIICGKYLNHSFCLLNNYINYYYYVHVYKLLLLCSQGLYILIHITSYSDLLY